MKAFYCAGTHWDREWYETFQEYRMWLVEQIDEVMDLMDEDPDFEYFHLDGQAVVLQDYFEIRPDQKERLLDFLKSGRILAGPWYVLPDEWLISGESFVRNFMTGMRVCRELGFEPMDFAYTPDQFGHVAALPMIVKGFGLKAGICWRGTQDEDYPAQFVWVGPDGSRMVTHKLTDAGGYNAFDEKVRVPVEKADFSIETLKEKFDAFLEKEGGRTSAPVMLMIDAVDHQRAPKSMPRIIQALRDQYPDIEFVWGTFPSYADEVLKHEADLPERTGEHRQPARDALRHAQYLIVHTLSSRYPIKQQNDQCQAMMEKWAEPCALFQTMPCPGAADETLFNNAHAATRNTRYLDVAWEYLIKNHPHDSICGCSIDQVHRDMMYRFDQCSLIADGLVRRAMAHTACSTGYTKSPDKIVVHNPLPFRRKGVFDVSVLFKPDWPTTFMDGLATAERINKFVLKDAGGDEVPFQLLRIDRGAIAKGVSEIGRPTTDAGDVYHLAVDMELPPCGFTGLSVEPSDEATRNFGSQLDDAFTALNEHIGFALEPNGTALLMNRTLDLVYEDLFIYEDCGDCGDGWTRGKLVNDLVVRTPGSRVTTAIEEDGPLRTVLRMEREFDLPQDMGRRTYWRSGDRTPMRVVDRVTLDKGSPVVKVRTRIENTVKDHRFRVLFPTSLETDQSFAETPFAVVARDIDIPPETARWHERVNPENAFSTFFGLQGQEGGLAILAPFGLHEYEVTQNGERALALTLFRSTFQTVATSGEPDGQLQGPLEFEYYLFPFVGQFDPVEALEHVAEAQAGVRTHATEELPQTHSFLHLDECNVAVTAMKPAADGNGGIVRLWNPKDTDMADRLIVTNPVKSAAYCDLNERELNPITVDDEGAIPVVVKAGGLATIRFAW
ncbi:MAG: hypothetical protein GY851_02705 [bacterium]|nr:hypothetical protein [bacterium]